MTPKPSLHKPGRLFCPCSVRLSFESEDRLLQGRIFSYADIQLHRIGTNGGQLPVNRPRNLAANHNQDGAHHDISKADQLAEMILRDYLKPVIRLHCIEMNANNRLVAIAVQR